MRRALVLLGILASACDRSGGGLASPVVRGPAATREAAVTIRVEVPPNAERVDLALDGKVLGELIPPYEYTWRTESLPDGDYAFTARVMGPARWRPHRSASASIASPLRWRPPLPPPARSSPSPGPT